MTDSLPRQCARTRGFALGTPHSFRIAPDGTRIAFLRSRSGHDPSTCLWTVEVPGGEERLVADPAALPYGSGGQDPPEELRRRERLRLPATGVTAFACDRAVRRAAFAVSGRLWTADLATGEVRELPAAGPVVAPRPDPTGANIAYVTQGSLRVIGTDGSADRELAAPEHTEVSYGLPEYVAAESMRRQHGYWWSPDGSRVLTARVDTTPVPRRYLADPAEPNVRPAELAYPAAGMPNADVSLWILGVDGDTDGRRVPVEWDRRAFEYVVAAHWGPAELLVAVESRDHTTVRMLTVDPRTGHTRVRREESDERWVTVAPGTPAQLDSGAVVWVADVGGSRRLLADGDAVTPPALNVREVCGVDGETVLFSASAEPTEIGLWTYCPRIGARPVTTSPGVHSGRHAGGTTVVVTESLHSDRAQARVYRDRRAVATIASHAETPMVTPRVELLRAGERELPTAILLPRSYEPGARLLPVLMDPYGGPARQRVLAARGRYAVSQWFADQGFAVVIADGRGTPGRGPAWEQAVHGDKGRLPLADQITALHAAKEHCLDLDLDRVGIRGWSFGGYLAALAVLRRPDVFHAAVAGAPVTDQRLYDTYWNERYLGHPDQNPGAYERSSLPAEAASLQRPLMLIHGLADDNVTVAHTLRLSAALTAAGRPHTVLPLPGATHLASRDAATENILLLEADFLIRALHGDRP